MAENKFLDDIAKFGNSTITAMNGVQRQVRKWAAEQVDSLIQSMELVDRKELDAVKAIAQQALAKVEELEKKLAATEGKSAAPKADVVIDKSIAKKVAPKKAPAKKAK